MKNSIRRIASAFSILAGCFLLASGSGGSVSQVFSSPASASGTGGPIVLDGMDPVCHASMGENTDGYIKKVIKSVYDRSNGPNNGRIAIIGSASSTAASCSGSWSNLMPNKFLTEFGTAASGLQPAYDFYVTPAEVSAFFNTTISAATPRMIYIPDDWGRDAEVELALTRNAEKIADFVNSGGGLFSSFGSYGWLSALLPGATFSQGGCNGGPAATADGTADFGLTDAIVAACWHGYFGGNIGTLKVLVDWPFPTGSTRKAVSIGGGSVSLPSSFMLAASPINPEAGQPLTITATAQTLAGVPQANVVVSMAVSSGPDAGQIFTATTSATGIATFTINTSSVGSNTYTATATVNGILKTVSVTTIWAPPSSTTAPPSSAPSISEPTTSTPNPTIPALAPTPVYEVYMDMGDGSCIIDGAEESNSISLVFIGYRYIPGPSECVLDGYSLSGWAVDGATESASLPLIVDPSDGVWRYFVAGDMGLEAVWSEHPIPTTTAPEGIAPPTTEHDHSSHDHGDLPKTGGSSSLHAWGLLLIIFGLGLTYVGRLEKKHTRRRASTR